MEEPDLTAIQAEIDAVEVVQIIRRSPEEPVEIDPDDSMHPDTVIAILARALFQAVMDEEVPWVEDEEEPDGDAS